MKEVLDLLQEHIKGRNNVALHRRAFTSCRQAEGESFDGFLVRLKFVGGDRRLQGTQQGM